MPDPIPSSTFGGERRAVSETPAHGPGPQPRRMRFVLVGLPLIAVFAAFGSIMWLAYVDATPGSASGKPPLVQADTSPIKIRPEDPGGRTVADQGEVRELIGESEIAAQTERLLPPPEEPVRPAEAAPEPPAPAESRQTTADGVDAASPAPSGDTEAEAAAALDALLSEVTRQEDAASDASAPPPADAGSQASGGSAADAAAPVPPPPPAPAPDRQQLAAGNPEDAAEADASDGAQAGAAPASPLEPSQLELVSAPEEAQVAAANPTYRVQLAAVRNESDARRAWDLFRSDLGDVIGGLDPVIERANTSNGTFYRVQVGPFPDLAAAESLCEDLKQRNASCFVIRR